MGDGTATLSATTYRDLLVRAGDLPSGMFVAARDICAGFGPGEIRATVDTVDGHEHVTLGKGSIFGGHISIGWPVGRRDGSLLVELPRETDRGAWRVWVPEAAVVRIEDLELAISDAAPSLSRVNGRGE